MNCYYYLRNLTLELENIIVGAKLLDAFTRRKGVIELILEKENNVNRLITDVRSQYIAFFIDRPEKTSQANIYHLFEDIYSKEITNLQLAHLDRHIIFELEDQSALHFLLYPPKSNVVYEKNNIIIEAFKRPDELKGTEVPQPIAAELDRPVKEGQSTRNKILRINPLLPRDHLNELIREHHLDNYTDEELRQFVNTIDEQLRSNPRPRWLVDKSFTTITPDILSLQTDRSFESVNDGIRYAYYQIVFRRRFEQEKQSMLDAIAAGMRKHRTRLNELEQSHKSIERGERYERFGHLLMAHAHEKYDPSMKEVELQDYFNDNQLIQIPLQQGKGLVENANYYYDKARKSRRSAEEAERQKKQLVQELDELDQLEKEVSGINYGKELNRWHKDRHIELVQLGLAAQTRNRDRVPFRRTTINGYELWIGKNASSNDELTSRAHKEDVWMHARGYPGSHLVIRMNRSRENPPREILMKAASYAAYYSQARGSSMVPVSYTRKKFVRKPKGADPGQVVMDREDVLLVAPEKPGRN